MKKKNLMAAFALMLMAAAGIVWAADHIDAPAVSSTSADITDYYAFQSPDNNDNMVFVCNVQGLLDPAATQAASFDENVLIEFNIDNDGDNVEDLVIQAIVKNGELSVYGPVAPTVTGVQSEIVTTGTVSTAAVTTYGAAPVIGTENGMKVFAGPRDDPFFMDFAQFGEILAGNATGFNDPGADTFAGTNVLSIVVEVPKSQLGTAATLGTWVEAKRKL